MGTSVGSKAVTLQQALIIAGVLEFAGAVLFGQAVSKKLATGVLNPVMFAEAPQTFLLGMLAVLITCGLWLNVATALGLPVSSTHAVVGAIAGFGWIAISPQVVNWQMIGVISLTWIITPVISGAIAAAFYSLIRRWILAQPNPLLHLQEWIPWLSVALCGVFGVLVLPTVSQPITNFLSIRLGWSLPPQDIPLLLGAIAVISITLGNWNKLKTYKTLEKLSAQPLHSPVESVLARFQLLSACGVAFAHGSNDVGNAVAPAAAIASILATGTVPLNDFEVPPWILVLGGVGIVAGLAVWGKKVISTIGEGIIPLQPSGGFCAELATATMVLMASRLGLPVSTSHALVGGVVGIGLAQNWRSLQFSTLRSVVLAWVVTIPITVGLSGALFWLLQWLLPS
jgi:PiT family inorganic phosphate transporter